MIEGFKTFLNSHNFNPAASLGYTLNEFEELIKEKPPNLEPVEGEEEGEADDDSLAEELRRIPHPRTAPLEVLREFEEILDSMGPWCASRAIFLLNNKLMGMKVQVPYVRHFLLLGALHTRLVWIQSIFNEAFEELEPLEVLENFSTPKLLGVLRILRRFDLSKPQESASLHSEENDEEEDSDVELTVADYLEEQKRVEQQAAARGGRSYHGRRKHYRAKFDVGRQRRKSDGPEEQLKSEVISETANAESIQDRTAKDTDPNKENVAGEGSSETKPSPAQDLRSLRRSRFTNRSEDTLCGLLICKDRCSARLL